MTTPRWPMRRLVRQATLAGWLALCAGPSALAAPAQISFMTPVWNARVQDWMEKELLPAFQARHPDIQVNVQYVGWGQYLEKLAVATAGGTAPDVFVLGGEMGNYAAANGLTAPLDRFVANWPERNDFLPLAFEIGRYGGQLHALPHTINVRHLFYRKDLLAQAGLATDQVPRTWEELLATVRKLVRYEGDTISQYPYIGSAQQVFQGVYFQAGGEWVDATGTRLWPQREAVIRTLEFLTQLQQAAYPRQDGTTFAPANRESLFANGKAAFFFAPLNGLAEARRVAGSQAAAVLGVAPATRGERPALVLAVTTLAVSRVSRQPEAAWKFLSFLLERANLDRFNAYFERIPPRLSLFQAARWEWQSNPFVRETALIAQQYGVTVRGLANAGGDENALAQQLVQQVVFTREQAARPAVEEALRPWDAQAARPGGTAAGAR